MENPKRVRLRKNSNGIWVTKPLVGGDKKYVGVYNLNTSKGSVVDNTDDNEVVVVDLGEITLDKFINALKNELVKLGVPFEKEIRNK